jgi:hypothetical protein
MSKIANKHIGEEFDRVVQETMLSDKPTFVNYVIVELNKVSDKTVIKPFKLDDWKKGVKKLLKLNDEDFDVLNFTNFNWVQKLTEKGYFVDLVDENKIVEVYSKGDLIEDFNLSEWKNKLHLIGSLDTVTDKTIPTHDHFIQQLFLACYTNKQMITLDKNKLQKEFISANDKYLETLKEINRNFKEEFILNYGTEQSIDDIIEIAKKYVGSSGYTFIEELSIDILNLNK